MRDAQETRTTMEGGLLAMQVSCHSFALHQVYQT